MSADRIAPDETPFKKDARLLWLKQTQFIGVRDVALLRISYDQAKKYSHIHSFLVSSRLTHPCDITQTCLYNMQRFLKAVKWHFLDEKKRYVFFFLLKT